MPPSPVVITLRGWNEKQAMSPCGRPIRSQSPSMRISLPMAQAASSITGEAVAVGHGDEAPARSQGMPIWWTARMARVRGVIASATRSGSML